ncbi:sigma-70 family RNA polymerase sigma factor [Conexibacter sp. SYSU D00693]|uniref:sigma-70 family RNA polymerase sigma factor n=1 Tax=Conexibacter sp. SYSU D00693 TaxID=2812560 RepID=UPI00196A7496|nr:sigma-70 family RNA polymerase sigma factor [Conexibacter sp. SYSU D00693]
MAPSPASFAADQGLLEAARRGDEGAYASLVEPHRRELHAHCYRMLGSVHDAEDALQDALLRAWRGLPRFDGRSSLRSWLYAIATNTSLDAIQKRKRRVLPFDHTGPTDPKDGWGEPPTETVWIEPYPDQVFVEEDGLVQPEARFERRESVELAFIAALQHLPANQRAALIMKEVLGFSAQEVADAMDTTVQSVNSALQRARKTVDEKLPERSQQANLRSVGDERVREVVQRYMDAMARFDVDAVVGMLAEEAAWSMPPLPVWFDGRDAIRGFLARGPLSGEWQWKHLHTTVNGQPASAAYCHHPQFGDFRPFALDVLTLDGERIRSVTSFVVRDTPVKDRDFYERWPEKDADTERLREAFAAFGLPERLG